MSGRIAKYPGTIYQLKGGVDHYLKDFPGGVFWRGMNFVFNKRRQLCLGNMNGNGGCLLKERKGNEEGCGMCQVQKTMG
jgi:predicted sulfurtransferase